MELQRVLAHDTRKAMEKVYELYGEDAMVVSNKKAQNQTELIVAIDLATQAMDALGDSPSESAPVRRGALGDMPNFDSVLESQVYGEPEVPRVHTAKVSPIAAAQNRIKPFEQGIEINPNFAVAKPADAPSPDDNGNLRALEIVDMVKQELASMRKEFKLSQQVDAWSGTLAVSDEMRPLIEAFNETGMPVGLRALMTDIINKHTDMISALTEIAAFIGDGIKHMELLDNMPGVHLIAGSSGSGKSLMAGRLCKQMAMQYGDHEVAMISYNDTRFGAWNQSQLIGTQAGVDTFRANNLNTLEQLLGELESRTVVIIDTPGVDLENNLATLTKLLPQARKHLVVAADASEASLKRHLQNSDLNWDSVMLSRLETQVYPWPIINALMSNDLPLSVAAAEPSIVDLAVPMTGIGLAQHTLTQLPIHFV
jgi:flagellar biosynthesis GTPase FlhF